MGQKTRPRTETQAFWAPWTFGPTIHKDHRRSMQSFLDRFIALIKWPIGFSALMFLPSLVVAWLLAIVPLHAQEAFLPVAGGFLGYGVLWFFIFRQRQAGSFLPTFFHELTHALFAVLTFHRVAGFRAGWSTGGRIAIEGEPNWLILVAPYFFPLAPILAACLVLVGPPGWTTYCLGAFGAVLAFHILATARDIHRQQKDLQEVGFPFAWSFLPAANLLTLGMILAATIGEDGTVSVFLNETCDILAQWGSQLGG